MRVTLHAVPHLFVPSTFTAEGTAAAVHRLAAHTTAATALAAGDGLGLTWWPALVSAVDRLPALRPGWLMQWSPAYCWYNARRSHLSGTVDVFVGAHIVAGTGLLGYAPGGAGWCVVDTQASGALFLHELGHVCGLGHVEDPDNLMCPRMTALGQHFTAAQLTVMAQSRWAQAA